MICSGCGESLSRQSYSNSQLKKKNGRRCKSCVADDCGNEPTKDESDTRNNAHVEHVCIDRTTDNIPSECLEDGAVDVQKHDADAAVVETSADDHVCLEGYGSGRLGLKNEQVSSKTSPESCDAGTDANLNENQDRDAALNLDSLDEKAEHIAQTSFVDDVSLLSHIDDAEERERHGKNRGFLKTISHRMSSRRSLDTSSHSVVETANGKLMAKIKHSDKEVADLSQRLRSEGEKNRKLLEALGTSNMTRDYLQEELKGTISKSKEVLKSLDEALTERDEVKKQNDALIVSCEEAEQGLQSTREILDCTLTQKASIEASFGQLNVEMESVRADNRRLKDDNRNSSEVCDGLRRQLKEAQDEILAIKSGPIAERDEEIMNLRKELDDLRHEKSKTVESLASLTVENRRLSEQVADVDISELRAKLKDRDVLIGEQENKLSDLYRADKVLREMNNSIIEEKALVDKQLKELEETHRSEMALLRSKYDEAAEKLSSVEMLKDADIQKVHDEKFRKEVELSRIAATLESTFAKLDKANMKLEELASINDKQRRMELPDAFSSSNWESFANWDQDVSPTSVAMSKPNSDRPAVTRTLFS